MGAPVAPLTPKDAMQKLRGLLENRSFEEGELREDDFGNPLWVVRRDLSHLDADAMNDRLHAWIAREVRERLPAAHANVRWDHAHPVVPDPPDIEVEDEWHDVEPTLSLDVEAENVTEADLRAWLDLVPDFLARLGEEGRPADWRDPEMGSAE